MMIRIVKRFYAYFIALLYRFMVFAHFPDFVLVYVMPKAVFSINPIRVRRCKVVLYAERDPVPPKRSVRFCFGSKESSLFCNLPSAKEEILYYSPRATIHNTIRKIFFLGEHYSYTPEYLCMCENLRKGIKPRGCSSIKQINDYFEDLHALYDRILTNGYKTQKELGGSEMDEIRIFINQGGLFCLGSKGNHRFRMAELIGVEFLPINLQGVSRTFLNELCRFYSMPPHKALLRYIEDNENFDWIQ